MNIAATPGLAPVCNHRPVFGNRVAQERNVDGTHPFLCVAPYLKPAAGDTLAGRRKTMRELRQILHEFHAATHPMALATIVRTTGSSYRRVGTRMLVLPDGNHVGTLSGGCIEDEVAVNALPVIDSGEPILLCIDTLRRFGCPGLIEIFVERIETDNETLRYLSRCFDERKDAELVTLFKGEYAGSYPCYTSPVCFNDRLEQTVPPPVRLIIVGDGADTWPLVDGARILGWDVDICETADSLHGKADARTAVLVKTHHFGKDAAALRRVLAEPFGYVGLLGSRKRRLQVLDVVLAEGGELADPAPGNLHGPAGLDLGADTPEEIAVSIVAEIQAVMARRDAGFLRDREGPIHPAQEGAACFAAAQ